MKNLFAKLKEKKGFTLIEMIIVIAIIAVLIALVAPNLQGYMNRSKITKAEAAAKSLYNAIVTVQTDQLAVDNTIDADTISGTTFDTLDSEVQNLLTGSDFTNTTIAIEGDGTNAVTKVTVTLDGQSGTYPKTSL